MNKYGLGIFCVVFCCQSFIMDRQRDYFTVTLRNAEEVVMYEDVTDNEESEDDDCGANNPKGEADAEYEDISDAEDDDISSLRAAAYAVVDQLGQEELELELVSTIDDAGGNPENAHLFSAGSPTCLGQAEFEELGGSADGTNNDNELEELTASALALINEHSMSPISMSPVSTITLSPTIEHMDAETEDEDEDPHFITQVCIYYLFNIYI